MPQDILDRALWLVRAGLLAGGGWLAGRGIGDVALWGEVAGAVVTALAGVWSYKARRAALMAEPPRA